VAKEGGLEGRVGVASGGGAAETVGRCLVDRAWVGEGWGGIARQHEKGGGEGTERELSGGGEGGGGRRGGEDRGRRGGGGRRGERGGCGEDGGDGVGWAGGREGGRREVRSRVVGGESKVGIKGDRGGARAGGVREVEGIVDRGGRRGG